MHSYDVDTTRRAYHSPVPARRLAPDATAGRSPTPIYDALYSEYRRSFRALPGDRSGEEDLRFKRFGDMDHLSDLGDLGDLDLRSSRHRLVAVPPAPRKGL
ncbi:hypothetical protein ACIHCQ_40780 [Streptomyces sp. NPDC052236]|uniref:hypothetical protein n=1 Tax=Streptomyces sp. NPDC052236 TaxID=3365686 RepID=UPI0037D76A32